ncbi:MAG: hypothetical protein KME20_22545 [Kaiparowitsia implicata GSE-PSE-MK54-09C]|jgi:hypothetical protein|nr:hypothetical protein [Kaiparowitsia implicata GSE-PSE-MK54-09C]
MNRIYWLTVGAMAIALSQGAAARADEIGLAFDDAQPDQSIAAANQTPAKTAAPVSAEAVSQESPLTIPQLAAEAPVQPEAHREGIDLPPPPPRGAIAPAPAPASEPTPAPEPEIQPQLDVLAEAAPAEAIIEAKPAETTASTSSFSVDFSLDMASVAVVQPAPESTAPAPPPLLPVAPTLDHLFTGGTESLVARTVGSAEGTRTPEGHRNPAFYGHTDPGNGVWNLGTFSYQHGAVSPEEADDKQLKRLHRQAHTIHQKAIALGLSLTLEETLNGIDLANQAPLAALDRGGYLDWLVKAKEMGMEGDAAIAWARTRSFIDPDSQQWNAPGLGNNINSISHDQERRMRMITLALNAYRQDTGSSLEQMAQLPTGAASASDTAAIEADETITAERQTSQGIHRIFEPLFNLSRSQRW